MNKYITRVERYCPLAGKNIVIERIAAEEDSFRGVCLNSHECGCRTECGNPLPDIKPSLYKIT